MRILVVEDEPQMAHVVRGYLEARGFGVDHAATLADADSAVRTCAYGLALLDRRLPDGDGLALLPALHARTPRVPCIVLSALDRVDDRVLGLDAGADDYLPKPFQPEELLARVRAALRRSAPAQVPAMTCARLRLETGGAATVEGRALALRRRELLLLDALMRRACRLVPRETLHQEVYGLDEPVTSNALEATATRLRRRLTSAGAGVRIDAIRGLGYVLLEAE